MKNLRAKLEVYDEDTNETIEKFDTYISVYGETEDSLYLNSGSWEMVEMELGTLQRRLEKKILNQND